MKRRNVTLTVDEDLLREARAVAAQRHTSVNEMVREFLTNVVSQERRRAALERIQPFLDRPSVHLGGSRPMREAGPEQGLAGLAGGWEGSEELVERTSEPRRS
jgi:hypothetical protein